MDNAFLIIEGDALKRLDVHPLARLVPASEGIGGRNVIDQPVVLLDGAILDGRARVREAIRLGLPCPCVQLQAEREDHPALVVARAMAPRISNAYVRAIVCARLVRCILLRPECLDRYDFGMATRLRRRRNLTVMLNACSISLITYDRAHRVLGDPAIESHVLSGALSLKSADRLLRLPASRRKKLMRLPDAEREDALNHYLARNSRRRGNAQASLDGMN